MLQKISNFIEGRHNNFMISAIDYFVFSVFANQGFSISAPLWNWRNQTEDESTLFFLLHLGNFLYSVKILALRLWIWSDLNLNNKYQHLVWQLPDAESSTSHLIIDSQLHHIPWNTEVASLFPLSNFYTPPPLFCSIGTPTFTMLSPAPTDGTTPWRPSSAGLSWCLLSVTPQKWEQGGDHFSWPF